ncbi:uncharacterized protein N7506_008417 [Penicillium brevicompactum]|uniref:uncharacterized protein n=1 Tax=Penicillium brevicompactum TaxID=5074 RepID=UPI00254142C1|nr:uncharacterized protein N7506_008417 [Penicillium brevicompactum]KAJ5325315.1 hypothetical protein N7506_008417 [Penicillium brevicompactum]
MPAGSCLCGNLKYEFTSEPVTKATCHCLSCRKISGSTNTLNLLLPEDKLQVTRGSPTKHTSMHESGLNLTVHFCNECGCAIYKTHEKFPGMVVVLAGTLDGPHGLEESKPEAELYAQHRVAWLPDFTWADQRVEF